jgi:hypothetical protein
MQLDDEATIAAVGELLAEERSARVVAVRELATELTRLRERVESDSTIVPPDLAEQLKAAALMLEQPPLFERPVARHLAGVMITRAGELAVSYSDGTSDRLGLVVGPAGEPGPSGRDGVAGAIGAQGDEGPRGRDGVSIMGAAINRDGELMLTLSDGTVLTPGRVEGRDK